MTRVMNHLPFPAHHLILGMKGNYDAASNISAGVSYEIVDSTGLRRSPCILLSLRQLLRELRPNLVLTYNWGAIEAVLAARLSGLNAVIHNESGFGADEAVSLKSRRVWTRRILLRGIHRTIVNSKNLLQIALQEYKLPPCKVKLIRNGIDVRRFVPGRNMDLRGQLGAGENTLLYGFVGRHRAEKNLRVLVEAFAAANIENAKLVLVGDGPERGAIEAIATRLLAPDRVIFPGEVDDALPYLQAFDVFVMSSLTEQTPNAMLEAMSCGLPAISSNVGDVRDILGCDNSLITMGPNDTGAMSGAMKAVAANAELRSELGARNRTRCAEHYSLNRMVNEFAECYQQSLDFWQP
ncbi:MAG TPA: glycosyltransferase [Bryobacteraceae bacterium]|nr:glycosyltransferase [Bryobacteraceae bacterium]